MESYQVMPFDITGANQLEYTALNCHINLLRRERLPDDPPITLQETISELQNLPPFLELPMWCAWDAEGKEIVGECYMQILHLEENQHLAEFEITVQPAYRRQGVGRKLLELVAEKAEAAGRNVLVAGSYDRIPAGETFLTRMGAKRGMDAHINQLRIAELDRQMIEEWMRRGEAQAVEFELGLWVGAYPEDDLAAIAELFELTNQQPRGDLQIEDMHMTPEQLRQVEQLIFARGAERWTYYVRERSSGRFAGYSETVWNPNRPEILTQDMTGVFPEFRKRGLGRWMKASMLDKVMRERPVVKLVRTGNADSNAAMLKINNELGFKPYMATTLWQVGLERVKEYLGK